MEMERDASEGVVIYNDAIRLSHSDADIIEDGCYVYGYPFLTT